MSALAVIIPPEAEVRGKILAGNEP